MMGFVVFWGIVLMFTKSDYLRFMMHYYYFICDYLRK